MLIGIFGNIGSGKTLLLTIFALLSNKSQILANYNVKSVKYRSLELIDLIELPDNTDVLIDEAYTWLESRASLSRINLYISYMIFQSRKRSIDFFITAQLESTIDIRFRQLCHVHFLCYNITDTDNNTIAFYYEVYYNQKSLGTFYLYEQDVREFYSCYDTNEVIEPRNIRKLKIELLSSSIDKLIPFLQGLQDEILKLIKKSEITNKYTKTAIKSALSTLNIPLRFTDFYYNQLNNEK